MENLSEDLKKLATKKHSGFSQQQREKKTTLKDKPNPSYSIENYTSKLSPEELRAIKRKGSLAGAEARKKKKLIRDTMKEIMLLQLDSEDEMLSVLKKRGIKDTDEQTAMCLGMATVARTNPQAFKEVYTILGEKPAEKVSVAAEVYESPEEIIHKHFEE